MTPDPKSQADPKSTPAAEALLEVLQALAELGHTRRETSKTQKIATDLQPLFEARGGVE